MWYISDQPTMENLIRYRMMMQKRQDDGDYETEDGLGFRSGMRYVPSSVFTHPSVASNGLGGSRRIVRLPDGRYGPSAFGQFTESSQVQPTFMHNAAQQPNNIF